MKKMYGLVGTIGLCPWAGAASAADTASASEEDQGTLTEIVVIAQKRTENLQNVPIAISTVSGSQLAAVAASSITAIADMTPGLQMTTTQGSLAPHIRGVGSDIPNVENSVALYLDGIYIGSPSAALLSLNNIQQIETLKGVHLSHQGEGQSNTDPARHLSGGGSSEYPLRGRRCRTRRSDLHG